MRTRTLMAALAGAALCTASRGGGRSAGHRGTGPQQQVLHDGGLRRCSVRHDADRHQRDRRDARVHRRGERRPRREQGHPCRRHPLRQAVLHAGATTAPIAGLWSHFADPMVYTPGDNEWTDCHKAAEGGGTCNAVTGQVDFLKDPDGNLGRLRRRQPGRRTSRWSARSSSPTPAQTLGQRHAARRCRRRHVRPGAPGGRAVRGERACWQQKGFVFVTLNIPGGSNNDADPWYGARRASRPQHAGDACGAPPPTCAGSTGPFRIAAADDVAQGVVVDRAGRHVGPRRQDGGSPDQLRAAGRRAWPRTPRPSASRSCSSRATRTSTARTTRSEQGAACTG